jgi:hypothetical protein
VTERDLESGIYRRGAANSCERKRAANVCLQVRSLLRRVSLLEEISEPVLSGGEN